MPDGPVLNFKTSSNKSRSPSMRKDSHSSLGSESMGSPDIISDAKQLPKRAQLSKKVSFRQSANSNSSDSDSGQSVAGDEDDEVFQAANNNETKMLLKTVNVQRSHSHRDLITSNCPAVGNEEPNNNKRTGYSLRCKRPKRSASFRDGLRKGESYQILMLGAVGVGKTSLVNQFQKANHCGSVNIQISNVYGENCRRSDDTQLIIFDHSATDITAEMALRCCDVHAYVIVYSVTDRSSFKTAQHILKAISNSSAAGDYDHPSKRAAILVGNKVDLVRKRVVSTEEGKNVAVSNGCKFIETSDWIDYNVGELFNGVLAQIRLRSEVPDEENEAGHKDGSAKRKGATIGYRRSKTLGAKSWGALKDFLNLINRKVVSCDDLQVL